MMKISTEKIKLNIQRRLRDYRLLLAIGLPLAGASMGDIATGLVDTALIGRYSVDALAAVGIGFTVFVAFQVLAVVLALGQQIITAQCFGAKNYSRVGRVLLHGLVVFLPISVLMALGASLGSSWIVGIIAPGASEATASAAADYILIRCAVIPMLVVLRMLYGILAGDKQTKWIFFGLILLNMVNIGLSYPLIYGFWFIPELGVVGSAWGSVIAEFVGLLFIVGVFIFKRYPQLIKPDSYRISLTEIRTLTRLSVPTIISVFSLHSANWVAVYLMGNLGTEDVATGRLVSNYLTASFALMNSFAKQAQIMAGRSLGAKKPKLIGIYHRRNTELLVAMYLVMMIFLLIYPEAFARLFTDFDDIVQGSLTSLRIVTLTGLLMAWALNNVAVVRGIGHTRWDMITNVISAWGFQIPLMWLLAFPLGLGLSGIFVGWFIFWVGRGTITQLYLLRALRNHGRDLKAA